MITDVIDTTFDFRSERTFRGRVTALS